MVRTKRKVDLEYCSAVEEVAINFNETGDVDTVKRPKNTLSDSIILRV
jgi:hypothetical protein